ncbi:MAG: family 16 glycosylhydrolase [Fibrobacterota bacterium]
MRIAVILITMVALIHGAEWDLIWEDDFSGTEIDTGRWAWDTAGNSYGWGNEEAQHYTVRRHENSRIENGSLIIEARREPWEGKEYTSARLRTKGKASWLYGRFEMRAKLPGGRGTWPAFWMLPEDDFFGSWPRSGEIDVMEYVGFQPSTIFSTVHTEDLNHSLGTEQGGSVQLSGVDTGFHRYAAEWFPDSIVFYVDSTHIYTYTPQSKDPALWPFNKPFHILLNCAVGGTWGGMEGIDTTIFPVQFEVDYVRVYRDTSQVQVETISSGNGSVSVTPHKKLYRPGDTVTLRAIPDAGYELREWSGTVDTSAVEFETVLSSHSSFAASFKALGELLINGDFSDSFVNWTHHTAVGDAVFATDDSGAVVTVNDPGENSWDIQLVQKGLPLVEGKEYEVSVIAVSPDSFHCTLGVGESGGDWTSYLNRSFVVGADTLDFRASFTAPTADSAARLFFDLGRGEGTLRILSVSLKERDNIPVLSGSTPDNISLDVHKNGFSVSAPPGEIVSWRVMDLYGRTVSQENYFRAGESVRLENSAAPGVYILSLFCRGRRVRTVPIAVGY